METGEIEERTTAEIVQQVASALRFAHSRGIAHRDLKPENICFMHEDPQCNDVKVIDWGLAFYFARGRMMSAVGSLTYAAPEVLDASESDVYTSACDLWSLGVLTYVMLSGRPPFWGSHKEQYRRMRKEEYPLHGHPWDSISKPAKSFIVSLLKRLPKKRLSIDQVVAHPWFQECKSAGGSSPVLKEVLDNMRQFSKASQFFSMCVASVARQLDHKSLRDIHKVFCELDTNGDGVLQFSEVKSGFERIFGADSEQLKEVEEMFWRLDLDGSGSIDYTEFCAAGIGERLSMQEDVLWAAFKTFDINDDDGRISQEEIQKVLMNTDVKNVLSKEVCREVARQIVEQCDADQDGSIDFSEWSKLMRDGTLRSSEVLEMPSGRKFEGVPDFKLQLMRYDALDSLSRRYNRTDAGCWACLQRGNCTLQ